MCLSNSVTPKHFGNLITITESHGDVKMLVDSVWYDKGYILSRIFWGLSHIPFIHPPQEVVPPGHVPFPAYTGNKEHNKTILRQVYIVQMSWGEENFNAAYPMGELEFKFSSSPETLQLYEGWTDLVNCLHVQ